MSPRPEPILTLPDAGPPTAHTGFAEVAEAIGRARRAQRHWAVKAIGHRLRPIRKLRHLLAEEAASIAATVARSKQQGGAAQTIAAELMPLAAACRFLEKRAAAVLRPRYAGRGRPLWLWGSRLKLHREPLGVVLVIAPSNYPLMLPGIESVMALAAGNAVAVKPAPGCGEPMHRLREMLIRAGLPEELMVVLDESPQAARDAIRLGVDTVRLIGSAATGTAVLGELAQGLTPATMELSGCDAAFVRADADVPLAAAALAMGITGNGGCTCIAPRRIFVHREVAAALMELLARRLEAAGPIAIAPHLAPHIEGLVTASLAGGARILCGTLPEGATMRPLLLADADPSMALLKADLFAPVAAVVTVDGDDAALEAAAACPYALGATVFAAPATGRTLARRINAGAVVVNDMFAPVADPRMPFGGRGRSGFGVMRGAEGLLSLTHSKAVAVRHGRFRPHFQQVSEDDGTMFISAMQAAYGRGIWRRLLALGRLLTALRRWRRRHAEEAERNVR